VKTQSAPIAVTGHRFARYVLWVRLMLVWVAGVLLANARPVSRRRIRQRYGFVSIDGLARLVRNLIILRGAQLGGNPRPRPNARRSDARPGFHRRTRPRNLLRATGGARLRRALKHRDPAQRIAILLRALSNLDSFAARLVRRLRHRLTRLRPLTPIRPAAAVVTILAAIKAAHTDTS